MSKFVWRSDRGRQRGRTTFARVGGAALSVVVPGQRRIDAARRQPIELPFSKLAQLRRIPPIAEIRSEERHGEFVEAIPERRVDHRIGGRLEGVEAVQPVSADPVRRQ